MEQRYFKTTISTVFVVLLVVGGLTVPVGAVQNEDTRSFVVALNDDGSARITLTLAYDLTSDDERDAFQQLKSSEETRTNVKERFQTRMERVASDAENATDRKMAVRDAQIAFSNADGGDTGYVKLSITYEGLAAVKNNGSLTVSEPFASGFQTDRPLIVQGPDGYRVQSATPDPESRAENRIVWEEGTDLSGFNVVFTPTDDGSPTAEDTSAATDEQTTAGGVGFGAVVAVLAILISGLLARR